MKKIFSSRIITIAVILALVFQPCNVQAGAFDQIRAIARNVFSGEPEDCLGGIGYAGDGVLGNAP